MTADRTRREGRASGKPFGMIALIGTSFVLAGCSQSGTPSAGNLSDSGIASVDADSADSVEVSCPGYSPGHKQVFWGDLHVHTAYSLDAYGFGTLRTPAEAYRFAKGNPVGSPAGEVKLDRPLDFMAVTDHAEWLDLMYTCTDPRMSAHPYCVKLRDQSTQETGATVFRDFVNPTLTQAQPAKADICTEDPAACDSALLSQWERLQQQTNEADDPCTFTALNGFEWSATPNYSHTHRNIIFASDKVTPTPVDYLRFPEIDQLYSKLEAGCRAEDGCDAITIAHNMNMGDGKSFDVETESERTLALRTRYERLVEITQEKGTSECLPEYADRETSADCSYENYITSHSRPKPLADFEEEEWEQMRSTYARGLLRRGLMTYANRQDAEGNPLQVGFIGSTDSHTGLGGYVEEDQWQGTVFGIGNFERNMSRIGFNPGGLVAVWAEQNTRDDIFNALKNRETYATSGPRIALRFDASAGGEVPACLAGGALAPVAGSTSMGSVLPEASQTATFRVAVTGDKAPLQKIEVIKGSLSGDRYEEAVIPVWTSEAGDANACVVWSDPDFDPEAPSYWYARVTEVPTPRWSSYLCQEAGRCEEFPDADVMIQEHAWASPIWHLPTR